MLYGFERVGPPLTITLETAERESIIIGAFEMPDMEPCSMKSVEEYLLWVNSITSAEKRA